MVNMKFQLDPRILVLSYIAVIALTAGIIVLLFQLDGVVNVSLYNYGLQFDYEWATRYWTFLRLALGLLGTIIVVSVFSTIVYVLLSRTAVPEIKSKRTREEPEKSPIKPRLESRSEENKTKKTEEEEDVEITALPIVCNKCGKVFTQPLCMFDFKSGKPRVVNMCPYCNAILAVSGNSKSK